RARMSRLIGISSERWSLARAIDALSTAARQAGRPGAVWIVGLLYPSITLGMSIAWNGLASDVDDMAHLRPHVQWNVGSGARPFLLQGLDAHDPLKLLLVGLALGPIVVLFASYLLAISILSQLALQSLAHNRRGVGSALLHGWRIMRHDAWATARAVLVDLL